MIVTQCVTRATWPLDLWPDPRKKTRLHNQLRRYSKLDVSPERKSEKASVYNTEQAFIKKGRETELKVTESANTRISTHLFVKFIFQYVH